MYKYLAIGHHHGDRDQHPSIPHRTMIIENLHRRDNPLFLIIGRGEEYEFLRDSRMFRNSEKSDASCFTNADMSFLQQFCNGILPERLEVALVVAVDCISIDAECRHTGAEPLAVRYVEDLSSEVPRQMLYFHYCRKSALQARQRSRIEELEATVNNMLTVESDMRAQDTRLLDSLRRAEQQAVTAEKELEAERTLRQQAEATVHNMLTVEDDLHAQNAGLLDSLHRAEQQAETAENQLETERTLRQDAEATVDNMLTVEEDLRAQNATLLDDLRRAEQQAETAENQLETERTLRQDAEATVDNMLTVEEDLRAQNATLLDDLRRAEQQAETAENELQAETTLRQQAEASRGRAVRRAEHRLRDEYARQHDDWYHDLHNYRTDREQYGPAFEDSVEAPGRASGDDRSWLNLRRETNELFTDLEIADNAQADLEADLSRVRRQRNHALQERDNLQGQLRHAQAYYHPHYHQPGRPYPR